MGAGAGIYRPAISAEAPMTQDVQVQPSSTSFHSVLQETRVFPPPPAFAAAARI